MTDGKKLKEVRRVISQHEKCSQALFAGIVGSAPAVIGRMETGKQPVSDKFKRRIYHATGAMILDEYEWPVARDNENAPYERFTLKHYLLNRWLIEENRFCPCCLRPYRD